MIGQNDSYVILVDIFQRHTLFPYKLFVFPARFYKGYIWIVVIYLCSLFGKKLHHFERNGFSIIIHIFFIRQT